MKNNKLKYLLLIVVALFTFISIVPVNAMTTIQKSLSDDEEYLKRNWEKFELSTKIQTTMNDYYNIKDPFTDIYPSYFGGMYVSDDANNLIIQVVKENIPNKDSEEFKIYNELINMDNSIEIEYVNNSFNDLNSVNNNVASIMLEKTSSSNISGAYIDVMNNKAVIELDDNGEEQQKAMVRKLFSTRSMSITKDDTSSIISFQKSTNASTFQNIDAGGEINVSGGRCSMGFRTRWNGKNGFVTAGHCLVGSSRIESGYVRLAQFYDGQKYDYGFVETFSNYTPTNKLAFPKGNIKTLAVVNYCPIITVNMAVAKSGFKTEYTDGKVKGLNQTVEYKDENGNVTETIKGLVKTDVKSDHGDSGSVVFIPKTDADGGSVVVGVLSGGSKGAIFGIGRTMYFTDITSMPGELQLRY